MIMKGITWNSQVNKMSNTKLGKLLNKFESFKHPLDKFLKSPDKIGVDEIIEDKTGYLVRFSKFISENKVISKLTDIGVDIDSIGKAQTVDNDTVEIPVAVVKAKGESLSISDVNELLRKYVKSPYSISAETVSERSGGNGISFSIATSSESQQSKSIEKLIELGVPKKCINIQKKRDSSYSFQYVYTVHPELYMK